MTRPATGSLGNNAFAACSSDVAASDGAPKAYIQLFPMGVVQARDGRGPYRLDDVAHAERVVAASIATAGGTDIPVDYDHQIPFGVKDGVGGNAPAAGWIKGLDARPDGIWARVEWTEGAAAKIKAREYRYISPFFGFDKATGALTRIWNAGLLNMPNFTEMAAVAAADLESENMDLKAVAKALGLKEDAKIDEIAVAAGALKTANDGKAAEIAAAVEAAVTKAKEEAAAAAGAAAGDPDPKAYVPMAAFRELQATVKTLQDTGVEERATAAVDTAVKAGKITPAGREHALKLFKADQKAFEDFVGAAPVVLDPGSVDTAAARANLDAALTPEEKAAASALGVAEDAYLASKKQVLGVR